MCHLIATTPYADDPEVLVHFFDESGGNNRLSRPDPIANVNDEEVGCAAGRWEQRRLDRTDDAVLRLDHKPDGACEQDACVMRIKHVADRSRLA
jgi:hypothetical protein